MAVDNAMTDELAAKRYKEEAINLANEIRYNKVVSDELGMLDMHAQMEAERAMQPPKITEKEIKEATAILKKYKEGKEKLENKIINDEEYWKMRQWGRLYQPGEDYKPATAWLWSCIQSRYSDAMDSYPTCNFLPRMEDDKLEAKKLSAIVPIILEQNRYEETYSDVVWYLLKHGGCVQGVFWDKTKHNGLGDIEIKLIDYLNLFWESGITDIQESKNLFCVELVDKSLLEQQYPQTVGHLNTNDVTLEKYLYDDKVDTENKSVVVDWYYHKYQNGKKVLHYCKYVNDVVLYATENDTEIPKRTEMDPQTGIPLIIPTGQAMSEKGLYDHAQYPFVCQQLYPIEGSLCGYGITDVGKNTQQMIDVLSKAITENAVVNASPRYFSKLNGINEEEFLNTNKPIVHVEGNLQDTIEPIQANQLNGSYLEVLQYLIESLKYVTSNQDVGNGIAPNGITAASAIAALQETQGKNARSSNKALYRAYRDVVYQVVELIRQFYDLPRTFRIAPDVMENSEERFETYTNAGLQPQSQMINGIDIGYFRKPEFDVEITAEKQSPYKKMEQNELALAFYGQGFFNPQMSDQAIGCLQMMDFNHKEEVMARIRQNGTIQELLLQYEQIALKSAQTVAQLTGKPEDAAFAQQLAQGVMQANQLVMPQTGEAKSMLGEEKGEATHMLKARNAARESTQE